MWPTERFGDLVLQDHYEARYCIVQLYHDIPAGLGSLPDKDHLLLQLPIVVQFGADPTRSAMRSRALISQLARLHSLQVKVQQFLDLLVSRRHNKLDDWHEQVRLYLSANQRQVNSHAVLAHIGLPVQCSNNDSPHSLELDLVRTLL